MATTPLRHWRLIFERTLRDVEAATHIPIGKLSLLERGLATPTPDEVDRIATALELAGPARALFVAEVGRSLASRVQPLDTPQAVR